MPRLHPNGVIKEPLRFLERLIDLVSLLTGQVREERIGGGNQRFCRCDDGRILRVSKSRTGPAPIRGAPTESAGPLDRQG